MPVRYAVTALFLVACDGSCTGSPAAIDGGSQPDAAEAGADADSEEDDVKPVYPDAPPNPLAARLCSALHETQENRRRECCSIDAGTSSAADVGTLCTRNLSAAIALKTVEIASTDVDACSAALARTFGGCDWVGPLPPAMPAECQGVIKGKLASGQKCRSTLECASGQACHGVGPTSVGRCGVPFGDGQGCGGSSDVLVTFARQDAAELTHPECSSGLCLRGRCSSHLKTGDACASSEQCESGAQCRAGKCTATLAKAGERCSSAAPCEKGFVCQPSSRCGPERKAAGATCKSDLECQGGCNRGTCGMKCEAL
jgi:hypothetical protein